MNKKNLCCLIVVFCLLVTGVVGCSSGKNTGGTGESVTSGDKASGDKTTQDNQGQTKLVVWDTHTGDIMHNASEEINNLFQKNYNVAIERVSKSTDAMDETLKAAFMSGDAPDVIYHEMGIGEIGSYVKAGYLLNLADTYEKRGWYDKLVPVSYQVPSVGNIIYGVGHEVETMSLYYNKTVFEKLGLKAPSTIEELTEYFGRLKSEGYTPLANTLDSAWYNNMNFIGTILYSYMSVDEINACMMNDASWDIPSVRKAVSTIKEWLDNGYFPPHPEADAEQRELFLRQDGICWVTGNWSISDIDTYGDGSFEVAIIPFPGSETCTDGGSQVNFVGSGFMVSASSKNQDTALDYVEFALMSPEACKVWSEIGKVIPPYTGEYSADIHDLVKLVESYLSDEKISNMAGINMWIGKNTFDFFSDAGQRMAIGALDVDSFIKELENIRQEDINAGNTKASFPLK